MPTVWPAARSIAATRRVVVVLPLLPVTSATGTSWTTDQSTAPGAGSAPIGHVRLPRPTPTLTNSSSQVPVRPCASAASSRAASAGRRDASAPTRTACRSASVSALPAAAAAHARSAASTAASS
jgi:hypothetical protein